MVPAALAAFVAAGRAALVACGRADEWAAATRRAVLAELDRADALAARMRAAVVTAEQRAGTWATKGDRDLAGFLGRESRQGSGAGRAVVGQAATLAAMPAVAEALVDGPVTPTHVQQLARAAAASPLLAAELSSTDGQARVLELAERLDGRRFGKALAQMGAALDPASRQRSHEQQRAVRYLNISHTAGGTVIKGLVDGVAGYRFGKAIDALNPRPARDDGRSPEQRRADALVEMVERTLTDAATTPGAVAPVQAIVTIREETWTALRRARAGSGAPAVAGVGPPHRRRAPGRDAASVPVGTRGAVDTWGAAERSGATEDLGLTVRPGRPVAADQIVAAEPPAPQPSAHPTDSSVPVDGRSGTEAQSGPPGSTADVVAALRGVPAVVDESGQVWPASEVARALCDCVLTRAVVDANGQVLDLGRDQRAFQRRHWVALLASGQTTCAWPGCSMPLRSTELHHLTWWGAQNGRTEQANCGPYCRYHHDWLHNHAIQVARRPDGRYEHRDRRGLLIGLSEPAAGRAPDRPDGAPGGRDEPTRRAPASTVDRRRGVMDEPRPPGWAGAPAQQPLLWSG